MVRHNAEVQIRENVTQKLDVYVKRNQKTIIKIKKIILENIVKDRNHR